MGYETQLIPISTVLVSSRIRKDTGDIQALAVDMGKHGLINPITVMDCQNGSYQLIAGLRRLEAAKLIHLAELRATVLSPIQAEEMLEIEIAENEQRLNFTTAERLEYAEKIKAIEQAKARERQLAPLRKGSESANSPVVRVCAQRRKTYTRHGFTGQNHLHRTKIG